MVKAKKGCISEVRDVLQKVVRGKPKITIENIRSDGDVVFWVPLKTGMGLTARDLSKKILRTRFFANTVGELLVRENLDQFMDVLTGLEPILFDKIICSSIHSDFGMFLNHKNMVGFQMHISLVHQIATEEFDRLTSGGINNMEETAPAAPSSSPGE